MTRLVARTFTFLLFAIVGLTMGAQAQSGQMVKANIPFEFDFGGHTLPAGEYSLLQPEQHLLVLRDSRGQAIAQLFTQSLEAAKPADETKLRFVVSEGRYRLSEVWQQNNLAGERLAPIKSRTKMTKRAPVDVRAAGDAGQP